METIAARTHRWLEWFAALSLSCASVGVVIWQNSRLAVLWDLSYILENSYRISLGQIPYRDFPFPYAPLTFLAQAVLIKFTGRVFFHHVIYCSVVGALSTFLTWRILLLVLRGVPRARLLALVLLLPLTVLGVYAVFPHPFYDPDCTFAVLACLLLLLHWSYESNSRLRSFITGAALVLPLFVKQNTGLTFIAATGGALVVLFAIDVYNRHSVRNYVSLVVGLVASLVVAVLLIHRTAGLVNYIQWTVRFAAQRRTPALAEMLGIYREPTLKWWLALFLFGAVVLRAVAKRGSEERLHNLTSATWLNSRARLLLDLSSISTVIPFAWPVVYLFLDSDPSERAERLINLWPLVLILSLASVALSIRRQYAVATAGMSPDRSGIELLLPLIIIATVHGAFMSQQLWGSTYALWPLFMILIANIISALFHSTVKRNEQQNIPRDNHRPSAQSQPFTESNGHPKLAIGNWQCLLFACVVSISLFIAGCFYVRSHERLDYANLDDGDLTHSKLPALKGLSMRGSWLTDFEELVEYTDKQIPRDDGILNLPGEDLFYYSTGRQPRFPVLMFDHTVNPYSAQEIVDLARTRNIQWLIVKDELQIEEDPIEQKDELMKLLLKDFESVDSLNNYEIYKRKSPDEDDSDNEESRP